MKIIKKPIMNAGFGVLPGTMMTFYKEDNVLLGDRIELKGYLTSYIKIHSPITGKYMPFKFKARLEPETHLNELISIPIKVFFRGRNSLEIICQKREHQHFIEIWKSEENSDLYFIA